jgi:excisionase family DNA binding protein
MTATQEQPHATSTEPLVKSQDVARELAVTTRYVGILTAEGRIPCYKFGRRCVRFRISEVLKALGAEVKG